MRPITYRQGDVTLVMTTFFTEKGDHGPQKKPEANGDIILVAGELTGHNHVMEKEAASVFSGYNLPEGQQMLVVGKPTVSKGAFLEGKVLEILADGTIRFERTDGLKMRFLPSDIEIHPNGAKVLRAYAPLKHPEHDAIPVNPGTYNVIQHHTVTSRGRQTVLD